MKSTMKFMLATLLLITAVSAEAASKKKADKETVQFRYEIEATDLTGAQGTYLVKVWTYSKKADTAIEQAKKNAVHGVLFKGFADRVNGKIRVKGKSPLITDANAYEDNAAFFKSFFADGGNYQRYVSLVQNGSIEAGDRIKVGKEYKIGVVVSVNVSDLRKYMESEKIIKSLDSIF